MSDQNGWEKVSEDELDSVEPGTGDLHVAVYRKPVSGGYLMMTVTVHDRRPRIGKIDLSTRLGRLLSVQTTTSTTFVPGT